MNTEEKTNELFETAEGSLLKIHDKITIGLDSGANLGITLRIPGKPNMYIQMNIEEEVNLLAFWLNKNFKLNISPDFKQVQEHEDLKIVAENRLKVIESDIDRMHELSELLKRCVSTLTGVLEAEDIKGVDLLSLEARKQIKLLLEEVKK